MNELYHHVTSLLRFECFPFGAGGWGGGGGGGEGFDYFAVIVPTSFKFISYPYKRKTDLD